MGMKIIRVRTSSSAQMALVLKIRSSVLFLMDVHKNHHFVVFLECASILQNLNALSPHAPKKPL